MIARFYLYLDPPFPSSTKKPLSMLDPSDKTSWIHARDKSENNQNCITVNLIETPVNTFANTIIDGNMVRYDPRLHTIVDLTSNFCSMYNHESLFV